MFGAKPRLLDDDPAVDLHASSLSIEKAIVDRPLMQDRGGI